MAAPGLFPLGPVGEGRDIDLQKEISGSIEAQVHRLIEQAQQDTQAKVRMELKSIRDAMVSMDQRLDQLLEQIDRIEPQEPAEAPLDAEAVGDVLSKIEQQWGREVRTLKQELHQTILAHNHNADLIKHHKDTIDALRERCVKLQNNNMKTSEIPQQLQRLDVRLKQQQQKQRKLEPLFERLAVLEQRVAVAVQVAQGAMWRYPAMPPGVPLPGVPQGIPAGMMPGMGVPPGMGMMQQQPGKGVGPKAGGAGGAQQGKASDKAAYKCPTDEDVEARLSKLSQVGSEAAVGSGLTAAASPLLASTAVAPHSPLQIALGCPSLVAGGGPNLLGEGALKVDGAAEVAEA